MKWKPYEVLCHVFLCSCYWCFNPSYEMEALRSVNIQDFKDCHFLVSILLMKWKPYEEAAPTTYIFHLYCFNPSYEMEALRSFPLQVIETALTWFQSFL